MLLETNDMILMITQ